MTLEEAIIQFKEDADNNRADLDMEWAEQNEQVAKWLEELKAIKEGVVFYSNRPIEDIVLEARVEAIDECENYLIDSFNRANQNEMLSIGKVTEVFILLFNQLKEQK